MMKKLSEQLLKWYDANARTLPWRGTGDPYRIWLSEIMLQQTRAETVHRYYLRFLDRFPDVFALAEAEQDEVLKYWEGLGYYSRARNLHAAAKRVAESGGAFPDTVEGLEALPGIGPYAARAIGSIAYDICAPALDGNQMRVLSRCFAVERTLKTPFDLEKEAMECMSHSRPGDYNQALMDLGSEICTPKKPKCVSCPLKNLCRTHQEGEAERYPLRPTPIAKRDEEWTIFLIHTPDGMLIQKRSTQKLLGGLYEFPMAEGHLSQSDAIGFLAKMGCTVTGNPHALIPAKHVFTHMVWHMQAWAVEASETPEGCIAVDAEGILARAFPSAIRKYREIALDLLADTSLQ